jgi:DNA-directed RNA polymerase subunit RPC12/RpoP
MKNKTVLCDDCGITLFYMVESGNSERPMKTSIDTDTEILCTKCFEKVLK